jgi:hypothetical protein
MKWNLLNIPRFSGALRVKAIIYPGKIKFA